MTLLYNLEYSGGRRAGFVPDRDRDLTVLYVRGEFLASMIFFSNVGRAHQVQDSWTLLARPSNSGTHRIHRIHQKGEPGQNFLRNETTGIRSNVESYSEMQLVRVKHEVVS
jgi:hypothetical protein